MHKVLIIDDEESIRMGLSHFLETASFLPRDASHWEEGSEILKKEKISVILLDLRLSCENGMEILKIIKKDHPGLPVIILTGYGNISLAMQAIRLGAYEFVAKPIKCEELLLILRRAIHELELKREIKSLTYSANSSLGCLMGKSQAIEKIKKEALQVAQSNFSVIIEGETGTGKTVLAWEIHNLSRRREKPFVKVDIGTLAESLIESELFGHQKGSFTGAEKRKIGFIEAAHTGTLFIDEIENMSHSTQSKLLNVMEDKRVCPVGSSEPREVDFRVITATNINIKDCIANKKIRMDLYYRLNEFVITLPPLRERPDDIAFFAGKFLAESCGDLGKADMEIAAEAMDILIRHPWPGNIRELKNITKKAVLFSPDGVISAHLVKSLITEKTAEEAPAWNCSLKEAVKLQETQIIKEALSVAGGNKNKAACLLGISSRGLYSKLKKYSIQ